MFARREAMNSSSASGTADEPEAAASASSSSYSSTSSSASFWRFCVADVVERVRRLGTMMAALRAASRVLCMHGPRDCAVGAADLLAQRRRPSRRDLEQAAIVMAVVVVAEVWQVVA